ncbi:MAG TPA: MFS transporter [Saprospiraceae bacterium]|nr:MFS transporter [Saprospiraceae bacterium]
MIRAYQYYIDSFRGLSNEIWLLALISLVNRAGTMVLPFLSIYLTDQLGFGFREAGIAMSVFGIGSLIGTYLGGKLADISGYYEAMFWSLITGGLMFFAFLWASSFIMVCLVILLAASFGEAYRPAMMASIAIYSKDENRTRSIALIRLAINLGYALGPAIGGLLAAGVGYNSLFIIDGMTCLMAGFLLKATLKEKSKSSQAKENEKVLPDELPPWRDREYIVFLIACTLCALVFMQLFYTAPVYFKNNLSLDEDIIGILLAVNAFIIAVIEMPIIRSLENRWNPVILITFGCALFALSYLFMAPWQLITTAIVYIIFITFGEIFSFPYANQLAMELSQKRRAEYLAYFSMSFSIAHILAPSLGLSIAESMGFSFLWGASGILSLFVCVLFYFSGSKLLARRK